MSKPTVSFHHFVEMGDEETESQQRPTVTKSLLQWISQEYYDMNGSLYHTLDHPPTSLEFARLVHISRPVVIQGVEFPALTRWTDQYLIQQMGERRISVAVTPNGRADAVVPGPDGRSYFAEPLVDTMNMQTLLAKLRSGCDSGTRYAYYLQSQNGNLYSSTHFSSNADDHSEFEALRSDVPSEIQWISEAVDRRPDAVNLWIGGSDSVTSIHSDPYENVYTVVRGTKHFTLLPPTEGWCLQERLYPHGTYSRSESGSKLILVPSPPEMPHVRWSSVSDPHLPGALPPEAHPIHITLNAGETLYLPVGWWHFVRQSGDVTIALNWWYDAEMEGMNWVWLNMLRGDIPTRN
ncbi:cupin-like domain-containing protein [Phlebopus sp. FC_14]|nr:cupin-like domain-containing protein [Phlebopus sp. FC_14]